MKKTRRRGDALEAAIVEAAWAELHEHGYAAFTVEKVAERAGTSRTVLARRWQNRNDLVVAALSDYLGKNVIVAPDLGGVRAELAFVMQKISQRGAPTVNAILLGLREYFQETKTTFADFRARLRQPDILDDVYARAIRRGEIDAKRLTKRVRSLPIDLVRHETYMTNRAVPRAVVLEMLDTIVLPLLGARETFRE